jgi:hypothetical protein
MFLADVSVDLGGLQAGVTEEFLHHPQVSPAIEQMGGKAVPEGVGVGGSVRPAIEQAPDVSRPEGATLAIEKEGVDGLTWLAGGRDQGRPAGRQPGTKGGRGWLADGNPALT